MKKTLKGFTLVELLVVIAIIGLLSTVAVVALNSARTKSRDAKRVADVKQIQTALELYFNDKNQYPVETDAVALGTDTKKVLATDGFKAAPAQGDTTYMGLIPLDPLPGTPTPCANGSLSTDSCTYAYKATGTTPTSYQMWFRLEQLTAGLKAGLKCATEAGIAEPTGTGANATCP